MSKLKTYSEFINEGLIDAVKNPIKWKKIKNNAKKFQKAKVAHALNDVDYAKKKASSNTKKETDVLKKTNDAKAASLKDIQSNIGTRMDDLATTPGLKQVVKLAKIKSSLAANKIIIKAATGEQAKQLKIKQKDLMGKVTDAQNALKDYETTEKPEKGESETDKLAAKNAAEKEANDAKAAIDTAKAAFDAIDPEDKAGKIDAEIKFKQAQQKKAKLEDNKELVQGLGDDIGKLMTKKQELGKSEPVEGDDSVKLEADIKGYNKSIEDERATMTKTMKELDQANIDKKLGRVSDEAIQKINKRIEDSKEDIAELKKKEADAKKKLGAMQKESVTESYVPLVESISDKFKRLRPTL